MTPDVNVLVASYRSDHPHHQSARTWLDDAMTQAASGRASLVLLGSVVFVRKNLIRAMMEQQVSLPEPMWGRLNLVWALFFLVMGCLNLYVAYNFDTDVWVNFKLFGSMGLMVVFILAQSVWLARHMQERPANAANDAHIGDDR